VQIAVTARFGLSASEVSSWMCVIWLTSAIASIALSLAYRQPIPITSTIPGLLFLGSLAGQFSYPELVGANLIAGVLIVVLGLIGIGGRILHWLPLPVAMGMLAGSVLGDVSHVVTATTQDVMVAGATVAGYGIGRLLQRPRIPPVGVAAIAGGLVVLLGQRANPAPIDWELPSLVVPQIQLSTSAFFAVSLPLVVLSMGLGNVQGLGFLVAQGYRVPANRITVVLGLSSVVNALLGGHTAIVSRNGMPIMAGPDAGPVQGRYWAALISATLTLLIALAAAPVVVLLGILPPAFIVTLAGLAILPSLQNALEKAFEAKLRFGAVVAFVVSTTSFSFLGISSGFWALVVAMIAALLAEPAELFAYWHARG
jgi:benzoate membrane transport protein